MVAPNEILTLIGQVVFLGETLKECGRRRTMTYNNVRTDNGACLYYKLTYEAKGSGELKKANQWCRRRRDNKIVIVVSKGK